MDARASKNVNGTTTTFKRSGADPVSPVLSEATGGTSTGFVPGISSRVSGTSTFHHSGIKNATLQTNSSQTNTATKRYDAFGNELSTSGTWQTRFDYGGAFGYQRDDDTGYKLLGHRYYDPSTGRFLTRDPIKDGRNWYAYCAGNPVVRADADGQFWLQVLIGFAALALAYKGAEGSIGLIESIVIAGIESKSRLRMSEWSAGGSWARDPRGDQATRPFSSTF